jgi:tetratricopeptide (TPR) repeat protein
MRLPTWPMLVLLCGCCSSVALAQKPAEVAARENFAAGEAAYSRGDYVTAIKDWQAAYASDPRPRIQYNIYQAHERLGDLGAAADALQRYLDDADASDPAYENAEARMASLRQRMLATGIRLLGVPAGAIVRVDDRDPGPTSQDDSIALSPGQHRIKVTLRDHQDFIADVYVADGRTLEIPVELKRLRSAVVAPAAEEASPETRAPEPAAPAPHDARESTPSERAARPFFIASAALGGAALIAGIWTLDRAAELDGCNDSEFYCANQDKVESQRTIALVTTTLLGIGAVGTFAYGIVLRVRGDREEPALACAPSFGGASCRLRF